MIDLDGIAKKFKSGNFIKDTQYGELINYPEFPSISFQDVHDSYAILVDNSSYVGNIIPYFNKGYRAEYRICFYKLNDETNLVYDDIVSYTDTGWYNYRTEEFFEMTPDSHFNLSLVDDISFTYEFLKSLEEKSKTWDCIIEICVSGFKK